MVSTGWLLRQSGSVRCPRGLAVLQLEQRRQCVFGCGELEQLGR
nr:MAG TPA: hypothetical protein [Caudoviricetes sp.]